ncbi:hypothetical protein [Kitasatospora sp. NPDC057223]|uniref:hypothetical protein n=1 Tax=Kitasatospora sp. NPDC057223 TaxID=3346055 RepID=UPI003637B8B9
MRDELLGILHARLLDSWLALLGVDDESADTVWGRLERVDRAIEERAQDAAALALKQRRVIGAMTRENGYRQVRSVVSGGRPESNRARF